MKHLAFRLKPGQLLKEEIESVAVAKQIKAGVILSLVGSLDKASVRLAGSTSDAEVVKVWQGPFEIVSGTGTVCEDGCHIHVTLSDHEGNVFGGHLKNGCVVMTTSEVVIGLLDDTSFKRVFDVETGFPELTIS